MTNKNYNNNNGNSDSNSSSDEDEENLIYNEYSINKKTKPIKSKNHNNSKNLIFKKLKKLFLHISNKNRTTIKILIIFVLFVLSVYIFITLLNNNNNNSNNKHNNNNNEKIIYNNSFINSKLYYNQKYNYKNINNYCNQFFNNKSKIIKFLSGSSNNNNHDDDTKCTFDLNTPNYLCTPSSKKRALNYKYITNYNDNGGGRDIDWNKPIISVIIPFFNTDPVQFKECIESVMDRQSFKYIEVILVDDGSTNIQSVESYRKWSKLEPIRFRVIVNKVNLGLPHSRNIGIFNSRGEYIFFLDSDDIIEPTALEKMVWKLKTSPHIQFTKGYLVGFGHTNYIWQKGFEQGTQFLKENQITVTILYRRSLFGKPLFNITNYLLEKQNHQIDNDQDNNDDDDDNKIGDIKYPKELLEFQYDSNIRDGMEDWDFHLKCAESGFWGETIPEIFEWYRRKDKKTTESVWKNMPEDKRNEFIKQLISKYPKLYKLGYFPKPTRDQKESSYKINIDRGGSEESSSLTIINPLKKQIGKPRILMILPWLNTGGADKFNLNVCKQLVENGDWEITIVTTIQSDNKWLSRFQLYTSDIFLYDDRFLDYSDYSLLVCYLIDSRMIDVLFTSNSEFAYYILPYIKSNCNNIPVIMDYNHMEEINWRNGGHPRQSIAMNQFLDHSLVSSNHLKEWMVKMNNQLVNQSIYKHYGYNQTILQQQFQRQQQQFQDKLSVLYINVDMNEFSRNEIDRHTVRSIYDIDDKCVVILFAARLTDQKKPLEALEIIKELKDQIKSELSDEKSDNIGFKVLFVGDGYLYSRVESYINKFGLSDVVKLLGDVPPQDMNSIISASDIIFLPSEFEGVSMVFYESMSSGVVPVGSDIGGQSELVSKDCGFLVNITNVEQSTINLKYIEILKHLISNPKKIERMGNKCKQVIRNDFQIEKMGLNLVGKFCNTIELKQQNLHNQQQMQHQFNNEFLVQTIEFLKLSKQFERNNQEYSQLYSIQNQVEQLKKEIVKLESQLKNK